MGDAFPIAGGLFERRYHIESVLGEGGFARIYLARQVDLDRQVAIKVLNPGLRDDPGRGQSVGERFRREAKLVASLRDPHTVIMHDYGQTREGLLYMVFEFIDGLTLSELVRQQGQLEPERVSKILRQALSSLQEAHAMGILHRDIKPANIMVYEHIGRKDQVKILDFGIAKDVLNEEGTMARDLTQAGMIIGTPRYMAPEQLRGHDVGPYTDIYSLGLIAFELLVGEKANTGNSMISVITRQVSEEPFVLPGSLGLSAPFQALIGRMLQKEVTSRFQDCAQVLAALDALSPNDLKAGLPHSSDGSAHSASGLAGASNFAHPGSGARLLSVDELGAEHVSSSGEQTADRPKPPPLSTPATATGPVVATPPKRDRRVVFAVLFGLLLLAAVVGLAIWGDDTHEIVADSEEGETAQIRAAQNAEPERFDPSDELADPSALLVDEKLMQPEQAEQSKQAEDEEEKLVEDAAAPEDSLDFDERAAEPQEKPANTTAPGENSESASESKPAGKARPGPKAAPPKPKPAKPKPTTPKPTSSESSFPALDSL